MKDQLYIGTYTRRNSEGIMLCEVNRDKKLSESRLLHREQACTYGIVDQNQFYSVFKDEQGAGLLVFDKNDLDLKLKHRVYSTEVNPSCHIAKKQNYIATANYGEGSVQLFKDNKLIKRYKAPSGSHMHFVYFTLQDTLMVCDLGLNQLLTFDLALNLLHTVQLDEVGPRHFVMNTQESILYLLTELSNELIVFKRDGFSLEEVSRTSILADASTKGNNGAAIRITKDERFIYTSSRNNEEIISVFEVNQLQVRKIQSINSGGLHPRDMNLSRDEKYIIVANKDSDNLVYFKRNLQTGKLEQDFDIEVLEPVCIVNN